MVLLSFYTYLFFRFYLLSSPLHFSSKKMWSPLVNDKSPTNTLYSLTSKVQHIMHNIYVALPLLTLFPFSDNYAMIMKAIKVPPKKET